MQIHIRTLIIVLGLIHLLQVMVFAYQYRINKSMKGIGFWLLWSAAEVVSFGVMLLRDIPNMLPLVIIVQNIFLVAGTVFIYFGVKRFFNKPANISLLIPIIVAFVFGLLYFLFIDNNIQIRALFINATLALMAFIIGYSLIVDKNSTIAATANFIAIVFMLHGIFFIHRFIIILLGIPVINFFEPSVFNLLIYFDAIIVSLLWTFGFIMMLNQQLNAKLLDANNKLRLIFNTSPDAAIITRLKDGFIVDMNEGYLNITGYTRQEMLGNSTFNIWKDIEDRKKIIDILMDKGFVENYKANFIVKNGEEITGLVSSKVIDLQGIPHIISIIRNITEHEQLALNMQESELRFSLLFNNMMEGMANHEIVFNNEGVAIDYRIIDVNKAFEINTGIPISAACGVLASQLYQMNPPPFFNEYLNVVLTKKPIQFETYFDQLAKYFSISVIYTKSNHFATIFTDITERKNKENEINRLLHLTEKSKDDLLSVLEDQMFAQKLLKKSEENYRYMFENNPQPMWIYDIETLAFMKVNNAAIHHYGYSKEEFLSMTLKDIRPKEDIEALMNDVKLTTQTFNTNSVWRHLKKNKEIIDVEIVSHAVNFNNRNARHVMVKDITLQKRAQDSLRKSERKLKEAQELAHLGFWLWNIQTGEVEWSDEVFKIFKLDPQKFKPQIDSILELSPWPEDKQRDKELIDRAIKSHKPGSYEQKFLRPDHSIGYYYSTFRGVYDEKDKLISIVGTVLDITKRKQDEEEIKNLNTSLEQKVKKRTAQLEASYAEMEAFSYSVSHDLRSPLRAINGFSKLLIENNQKMDNESIRLLDVIIKNTTNMGQLIDDLLTFAKVGKANITATPINMREIVKSVTQGLKNEISKKNIAINIEKIPDAIGDPVLLTQVWNNLIRNAIKFSSKSFNPEINISSYANKNEIVYLIKDNGVGFDMRFIDKLFRVFERLHTSEEFEGTGIGLAIVKKAINRHGGKVWAESVLGEGATFYFSLPAI